MLGQLSHIRFTDLNGRDESSMWEYYAQPGDKANPIGIENLIHARPCCLHT
jgi:hypothetical protein